MSSNKPPGSSARRICVVGGGRWGKNHIRVLAELGHLAGVVDIDAEKRARYAGAYPEVDVFSSVAEALERPFDGFVVATPSHTHVEVARPIIERGVHLLVEKPLALHAGEARDLCRRARAGGVHLMVGHVLLFHPAIRKIRELIDRGKLGRIQYLYSNRLNLGTVRTEENILWSFAPHDISIFQYFLDSLPSHVESRGGVFLQPEIHDTTMTLLRYPGNVVGHIFLSWLHPYKEHRLVVVGSKGMISFDDSAEDKPLQFYEKGIDWVRGEPKNREGPTELIDYERLMPLTEELRYFAGHLDGAEPEIATGESAVEVLEILARATEDLLSSAPTSDGEASSGAGGNGAYYVHPSSYIDERVEIGAGTKIWHFSHVQRDCRIGQGCTLGQNVNLGAEVVLGNHVKVQNNVSIYHGVELEDYVFCGPSMVFTNVRAPRAKYPQTGPEAYERTLVREGASLGANATIVCGITVGRHAFVAAGAVVSKDVPDHALVAGVPARRVGWVCECGERLREDRSEALCGGCGRCYVLERGRLSPAGS